MILPALMLVAAVPAVPAGSGSATAPSRDAERYALCLADAGSKPAATIVEATKWLGAGGGVPARHCLALAYLADRQYGPATQALDTAARAAEAAHDPHVAELWGQAGNAALLGGKMQAAYGYFTTGIAAAPGDPAGRAQLSIDRARALVELKRLAEARADLDTATRLDPAPALGWLLRATLARRQGDLVAAEASLLEATRRTTEASPEYPDVTLEAGNIAAAQGKLTLARQAWTAAAASAPGSPAAIAATQALAANPG